MAYTYSTPESENRARAVLLDAPITYKVAVLIGKRIKDMPTKKAVAFLKNVVDMKEAIPYTKFSDGVGHKPGIGPGRYPEKAAKLFIHTINNAVANAEDKGLGSDVTIERVVSHQGSRTWHHGRLGRRKFKRSHVEIIVTNAEQPRKAPHSKKPYKKKANKEASH